MAFTPPTAMGSVVLLVEYQRYRDDHDRRSRSGKRGVNLPTLSRPRSSVFAGFYIASALLLIVLLVGTTGETPYTAVAYTPANGDHFTYSEMITVSHGQGSYLGYTDNTVINGEERVTGVNGSIVSSYYDYVYNYTSNQGNSESGSSSGFYSWSAANYTYLNGTDNQVGYSKPTYVWFAMNASTPVGGTFYVLNTRFTVLSKNYSYFLPLMNRYVRTIEAAGQGQYQRNDSYGVFAAQYTWYEYFDPSTGYIVGYSYVEHDTGEYQGQAGSFQYTDNLSVVSTSYPLTYVSSPNNPPVIPPPVQTISFSALSLLILFGVIIIAVFVGALAISRGRRRKEIPEHPSYVPPPPPSPVSSSEVSPQASPQDAPAAPAVSLGSQPPEQVVIKEVVKVKCKYCGTLIPTTAETCPYCGAPTG